MIRSSILENMLTVGPTSRPRPACGRHTMGTFWHADYWRCVVCGYPTIPEEVMADCWWPL